MKNPPVVPRVLACTLLSVTASFALTAGAETGAIEEVVVVGSRIEKPDYAFSNPVQSVDAETIRYSGTTNLGNFLKEYPALVGSLDANDAAGAETFIGGTGLTLLNLRNLGTDRTLVLVDSRRHVAALPGSAAVDIDTIPIDLIERIEILTGGASAVYGADGVSGVVNFVMKDDFEGFNLSARTGQSSESDAQTYLVSGTAGSSLFEGRGHGTVAVEWAREEALRANDRDFAGGGERYSFVSNPDEEESPERVPLKDIRFFDSSPEGAVDTNFDFVQDFNGTDTPWNGGTIPFISPFYQQGGDGSRVDQFIGDLLPDQERVTVNGFFDYEIAPKLNFFSELKYSQNDSFSRSQPTFDFFLYMEPDYAYYPPNIAAALADSEAPALVSRDHFELGVRGEDIERETLRGVLGLEGDLTDNLSYEVSYVYGETEVTNDAQNNRYNDRFAAALDAVVDPETNQVVCRSNLDPDAVPFNLLWQDWISNYDGEALTGTWAGSFTPGPNSGCVPLNIIGTNVANPAALDWIMTTSQSNATLEQQVAQAYLSGDSEPWFTLPAGPVGFAAGVEWREEKSSSDPAFEDEAGLTFGNKILPVKGDYDVREAFLEINVPLLSDLPGVQELTFDAAGRISDYSTIGNAETWKLGLAWQPIDDVIVRGTLAEATRSPNIGELFDPGGQTFEFISDPCAQTQIANGSEYREANCVELLTSLGVADPGSFEDPNSAGISGTLAGNPDLSEEVADTRTIGVIIQPRFIENLTVTVDWYDIELEEAINTALPEEAAQICVDLPTLDNEFCNLIDREAGTGAIVNFVQRPLNVAEFTTEGYDFTIDYLIDPAELGVQRNIGTFNLGLVGNHLDELTFVNLPGAAPDEDLGEEDIPEWQYKLDLTWQYGALLVNYAYSWFDETQRYTRDVQQANPDIADSRYFEFEERKVHDVHVAYDYREGLSLYAGVNNLTDEQPDIGQVFYPVSAVGRFFYFGIDMQFDFFR